MASSIKEIRSPTRTIAVKDTTPDVGVMLSVHENEIGSRHELYEKILEFGWNGGVVEFTELIGNMDHDLLFKIQPAEAHSPRIICEVTFAFFLR